MTPEEYRKDVEDRMKKRQAAEAKILQKEQQEREKQTIEAVSFFFCFLGEEGGRNRKSLFSV